jgi:hypothetical protein
MILFLEQMETSGRHGAFLYMLDTSRQVHILVIFQCMNHGTRPSWEKHNSMTASTPGRGIGTKSNDQLSCNCQPSFLPATGRSSSFAEQLPAEPSLICRSWPNKLAEGKLKPCVDTSGSDKIEEGAFEKLETRDIVRTWTVDG